MADTPNLAKGESEVDIDKFNIWLRGTPQYQDLLKSWGQDPGHPHNLNDSQKTQITRTAQALGAKVDESSEEVDDNGNFRNVGHKLRNTLIVAGIAAASIATMGAAGMLGGAALGGADAAGAAAGLGGVEAGATAGIGSAVAAGELGGMAALPALAGGATAAGIGGAAAAGLGGVEGGAASGLGAAALPGAGTALGGATAAEAAGAVGATGAAGDALASSATVPTATGTVAGGSGMGATGLASDGSTLAADGSGSTLSSLAKGGVSSTLQALGKGVGDATTAAGNNALNQEQLGLQANNSNIAGQSAFENELMNRAKTEAAQRNSALADVYRQSYATNGGTGSGPRVSPYNPAGSPAQSPAYLAALKNLQGQGSATLANPAAYSTTAMPTLKPYNPIDPANVQGATNTKPSALQTAGEWVSPALSTLSALSKYWGS